MLTCFHRWCATKGRTGEMQGTENAISSKSNFSVILVCVWKCLLQYVVRWWCLTEGTREWSWILSRSCFSEFYCLTINTSPSPWTTYEVTPTPPKFQGSTVDIAASDSADWIKPSFWVVGFMVLVLRCVTTSTVGKSSRNLSEHCVHPLERLISWHSNAQKCGSVNSKYNLPFVLG